jgi:hypothetical protein|tara:strand:- start:1 stop:291 length:291 start_codon:yes stop_codon:yes gene_type:complete
MESMFKYCPKIEKACAFCGEANWNPITDSRTDEPVLFCGMASGYETRVAPLPECWLKMNQAMRTKYRKQKRAEYEALNPKKLDYKVIGTKRYKKSY